MPKLDIPALQKAVSENRYFITTHAKQRMGFRQVSDEHVKRVILDGELIEEHSDAHPFPKALFMASVQDDPAYVSCAFDGWSAYIITVHWYDPEVWIDPRTRRKK